LVFAHLTRATRTVLNLGAADLAFLPIFIAVLVFVIIIREFIFLEILHLFAVDNRLFLDGLVIVGELE
jgi:hypothetical protein